MIKFTKKNMNQPEFTLLTLHPQHKIMIKKINILTNDPEKSIEVK